MHPPIGLLGLGIMGSAIAVQLMKAGHTVIGFDPRASRRRALQLAGGSPARRGRDVGRRARIVITSLPSAEAMMETASELTRVRRPPAIVIDTSTLPIEIKRRARTHLRSRGIELLDCPISGTGAQARQKDVAIHNVAAAEALVLAMKAGLDPATALRLVSAGAGSSRMLELRGPMMVKGDYAGATMTLANWQKDMAIIADFARRVGSITPLFSATAPIYAAAARKGSREDTAAVCAVIEEMAHHRRIPGPTKSAKSPARRAPTSNEGRRPRR